MMTFEAHYINIILSIDHQNMSIYAGWIRSISPTWSLCYLALFYSDAVVYSNNNNNKYRQNLFRGFGVIGSQKLAIPKVLVQHIEGVVEVFLLTFFVTN